MDYEKEGSAKLSGPETLDVASTSSVSEMWSV